MRANSLVRDRTRTIGQRHDQGRNLGRAGIRGGERTGRIDLKRGALAQRMNDTCVGQTEEAHRCARDAERAFVERDGSPESVATGENKEARTRLINAAAALGEDRGDGECVRVHRAAGDDEQFLVCRGGDRGTGDGRGAQGVVVQDTAQHGRGSRGDLELASEGE